MLRDSDAAEGASETIPVAVAAPSRGFNGTRGEIPSMRAKRLRIERGEQQAPVHIIADIEFGRDRFVLCACGFGCGGSSDRAMSDEFDRHAKFDTTARVG